MSDGPFDPDLPHEHGLDKPDGARGFMERARALMTDAPWIYKADQMREQLIADGLDPETVEQLMGDAMLYEASPSDIALLQGFGSRVATTKRLRSLLHDSERRGYNRHIPSDEMPLLAPEGRHLIIPIIVHRFIGDTPSPAHIRARVLMKFLGSEEPHERLLDLNIDLLRKLPKFEPRRRTAKPNPTWEYVLDLYTELYEQSRIAPAAVDFEYENVKAETYPLDYRWIEGLEPWYVTEDMVTLVEAAADEKAGIGPHPLQLDEMVTVSGFMVLERVIYDENARFGETPIRAISWIPATVRGQTNLHVITWIDLEHEDAPRDINASGYRARLWPGVHWWWPVGQASDAVLSWENATPEEAASMYELRKFMMAAWLISGQRVALITGFKPARAMRRRAERLKLPSKVNIVTLRRAAPRRYDEGDPRQVEWSHQWLVTGHWRHLQSGRVTWVSPYIKGPTDKPLIIKDRLYKLER
jgi:hypothetical protein